MADMIKVYQAYSPKIKIQGMLEIEKIVEYISGRTNLNSGTIRMVFDELQESLVHFSSLGHSIRLEGIGSFSPTLNKKGDFGMNYRPDKNLLKKLADEFDSKIRNDDMLGKTPEQFIDRWNTEHPDDPVKP